MNPQDLSVLILGLVGIIIQLVFAYLPKLKTWYEAQTNKGLIMLAVVFVTSLAYFGLGCTSLAVVLKIVTTCTVEGAITVVQAFFIIASSQQLTYLFLRNNATFRRFKA